MRVLWIFVYANHYPPAKGCNGNRLRLPSPHRAVSYTHLEGYVTGIALDEHDEIIGYKFVSLGKFTDFIKAGDTPNEAWEKAQGQYGRVDDAAVSYTHLDVYKRQLPWIWRLLPRRSRRC